MKLKVVLVAGLLSLSGQSAFAATDTSCNPFARGENCGGVWRAASVASGNAAFNRIAQAVGTSFVAASQSQGGTQIVSQFVTDPGTGGNGVVPGAGEDNGVPTIVEGEGDGSGISVVPVPAAGFLLLAGLGGLVALRRKK